MLARIEAKSLERRLQDFPDWHYDEERTALRRSLLFADFAAAFMVMTRIAFAAEKMDHHPEWSNVYNRLDIWLTTHDVGGISERDFKLAGFVDQVAAPLSVGT